MQWKFWKNSTASTSTSAKNAEALKCRSCFQAFLSAKVISPVVPAQQVLVRIRKWNSAAQIMRRTICQIGDNGAIDKHSASMSIVQFVRLPFQRLLRFASRALEYCFGMYIGALLGWLAGWCTGRIYVEYFEPVYLSDFSGIDDIMCWDQMPRIFAGAGLVAGAVIGAVVTFCSSHKTSNKKNGDEGSDYLESM